MKKYIRPPRRQVHSPEDSKVWTTTKRLHSSAEDSRKKKEERRKPGRDNETDTREKKRANTEKMRLCHHELPCLLLTDHSQWTADRASPERHPERTSMTQLPARPIVHKKGQPKRDQRDYSN